MLDSIVNWFSDTISEFTSWLIELVTWAATSIYESVSTALGGVLAGVFDTICQESCLGAINSINAGLASTPPLMLWAFGVFQIPLGVSIILGAYIVRFIIRRIPIIG